ncbi:hypothetical protein B296_00045424 [Ensete ventricosum]|uniref:Uncharacterized protein n=1 Tax=Ensete ventricosum TaxID=4639 RepID=A0A426WYA7_ENSVE|nr:hypothetical protein B296_00045424 [Ensete ventricosum]
MAKAPLQWGDRLRPSRKGWLPAARSQGAIAPWQGACQSQKATAACAGEVATAAQKGERGVRASFGENDDPTPINLKNSKDCPSYIFLVYCWACILMITCNYMERHDGSVEMTAGPTML